MNRKHKDYKLVLDLRRQENELEAQKKALGYIKLEKPIHHGFNAYLTLREDVVKRDDEVSYMYQYMIDKYATEPWSRTKEFYHKRKGKTYDNTPKFRRLSVAEYNEYKDWAKAYFRECNELVWGVWRTTYVCDIPNYYLVMKIKSSYITHRKVIDSELESQIAYVDSQLDKINEKVSIYNKRGNFKWYQKYYNQKDRGYNKRALKKNLNTMFINDSVEYHNYQAQFLECESHRIPMTEREFIQDSDWTDWASSSAWSHDPVEFRYKPRNSAKWNWW